MGRLTLALTLAFAPFLSLAYYHAAKVFLARSQAARFLENGGSIDTAKLDSYHATLQWSALLGAASSLLLAIQVAELLRPRNLGPATESGRSSDEG